MLIAGIDEAGRGCVVGPLVIAGVMMKQENLSKLAELGVKDSKLLTAQKRANLADEISRLNEKQVLVKLSPEKIDRVVQSARRLHKLNRLEAESMAEIVTCLKPDVVYVDAADVVERRFGHNIVEKLSFKVKIVSEHRADCLYPVVSAASIIAKVARDSEVAALRERFGDFGSGYLSDKKTRLFLENWMKKHEDFPDFVRKSWKTAKRVKNEKGTVQTKLS